MLTLDKVTSADCALLRPFLDGASRPLVAGKLPDR